MDPSGEFVFVANSGSNNVTVFSLNLDTGNLTPVPGSPFAAGSQPLDVATDGFGRFLYVANNLSNSISAFSINQSNGSLTPVAGSPFSMGNFLSRVAADPLGRFLYAMDGQGVFVLTIGATGALTPAAGSPLALNPAPSAIATDPSGQFLLVTQRTRFIGQNDTVASYRVNANGSLTPVGSPVALGARCQPFGRGSGPGRAMGLRRESVWLSSTAGFSLQPVTGVLTPIPGSPFPAGRKTPLMWPSISGSQPPISHFARLSFLEEPAAAGGTPPYSWSISAGTLPPGLALNAATGIVSGTPTGSGHVHFHRPSCRQHGSNGFTRVHDSGPFRKLPGGHGHSSIECPRRGPEWGVLHHGCDGEQCDHFQREPDFQVSRQ